MPAELPAIIISKNIFGKETVFLKKQNFFFASMILILSAFAAKLTGAIFRIPLANMLGGTGMGYFSGAYSIFMTIYAVSVTGLPAAVAKATAENSALERYADVRKIRSSALLFFSLCGTAFTLLMLFSAYPFCKYILKSPETFPAVIAIAPSVFFGCVTAVYRGYYEGLRNMFPTAVSQIVEGLVKLCAGLFLCLLVLKDPNRFTGLSSMFGTGKTAVLSAAAAASVFGVTLSTAAGTLFLILRDKLFSDGITEDQIRASGGKNCTDSSRDIIHMLLKTAVPVAAGALAANMTSLIDLATITRSLGTAVSRSPEYFSGITGDVPYAGIPNFLFGCFTGLAVTVFNLVPSFTNMFGKGILPAISGSFASKDKEKIRAYTEKAVFATALVSFPSSAGITVLAGNILKVLFPAKPAETAVCTPSLTILGTGVAFLCLSSTFFAILQAAGHPELPVKLMLIGIIVKFAGNILLVPIPSLNISGAAISTLLCYGAICIPAAAEVIKHTGADKNTILEMLCKISFCSLLCGGAALLAENIMSLRFNGIFLLFISILCGVIFYIISAFLLGIITKNSINSLIS